ncbi:UDP-2,4-diacetamido-2,4,6-trideoxy-beta-L-altropyranose hydrolase [Fibrella sp. HMF5335]|uniref:UDP-2,4-diacetamido-2,4, 6-trideoxy-beta-L-altropyranose hydrolase n=1 Tax=Fibrella rubiginis TaxID=2817060 RepID=A0A939GMZ8_9BACT|nr:UDP-2,4-diacetamido-2,4,6-trideoxy-beta-L-altropyranose hydrolase [Fibrella rubiginis]MBO0939408.1 UDP-2,4-diacetamido-2,4,6-trideoxy-beta-L-altropyranose hydrolase [Fibrella rubiginis]
MKKLLFRADGTTQTGLGHIMRSLALAEMLGESFDRRFAIQNPSDAVLKLLAKQSLPVIALGSNNIAELLTHVSDNDVVVLDGYDFDEAFQRAVREKAHKLVFIDDLIQGHQVADVVINHAGDVTATEYETEPYTTLLLGTHYALVNPAFVQKTQPKDGENKAFVNMGGADLHNVSHQVVDLLLSINPNLRITLALGAANPHADTFADFPKEQLSIQQNLSAKQMARAIGGSGLSVVAASTIAYEVASISRPMIVVQTADNQGRMISFMRDRHLAVGALTLPINAEQLALAVKKARLTPSVFKQRLVFDGKAADRYRQVFTQLCA